MVGWNSAASSFKTRLNIANLGVEGFKRALVRYSRYTECRGPFNRTASGLIAGPQGVLPGSLATWLPGLEALQEFLVFRGQVRLLQ